MDNDIKWAAGFDPELKKDKDGNLYSDNPNYPCWSKEAQMILRTEIEKPDKFLKECVDNLRFGIGTGIKNSDKIIVECVDNTGIEDQFDIGLEYVLEGETKDFFTVYDKIGRMRECFKDRFKEKKTK